MVGVDRVETARGASATAALLGAERARHDREHRRWAGGLDEEQAETKAAQSGVCLLGIGMGGQHDHAIGRNASISLRASSSKSRVREPSKRQLRNTRSTDLLASRAAQAKAAPPRHSPRR